MASNATDSPTIEMECLIPLGHAIVMIIFNVISSIFGSIGNSLVCATIYTTTGLQTVSNYFLVSLAVADLIVTVVAQPLLIAFLGGSLGGSCLQVVEFLFRLAANFSCSASVLHLCFISVDRCLMVTRPHTFTRIMTKMRCRVMLLISWFIALAYGVLRLTVSKRATSMFTVVVMAICFVIILISYSLIIFQVRKQRKMMQSRTERYSVTSYKRKRDEVERRVAMTIGIVIIVFIISWLPIIFLRSRSASNNSGIAYNWARTLALCNSAMNPWIYCYRIPEFRAAYKRLLILCNWGQVKGSGLAEAETTMTSDSARQQRSSLVQDEYSSGTHDQIVLPAKPTSNGHAEE